MSFVSTNPSSFEVKVLSLPDGKAETEWARPVRAAPGWGEAHTHNPATHTQGSYDYTWETEDRSERRGEIRPNWETESVQGYP